MYENAKRQTPYLETWLEIIALPIGKSLEFVE
jgi:hypothetical protein